MSLPRVLVIKAGSTHPEVVRSDGDYDAWFVTALREGPSRCEVVEAFRGAPLPDPAAYGGAILTGSPCSVRDEAPWMRRLAAWALAADERGLPVLAVCFGHQLVGEALGGRVEAMACGPERGTGRIELTPEGRRDPLFAGLPDAPEVQQIHGDGLASPPPPGRAIRLAGNAACAWQAFAAGRTLRAVQFHPELPAATLRRLLEARGQEGEVRETGHGLRILRNWDERFVRKAG